MEPQPPSPALSRKVMPPEPLPKGSARCLDPHARAMVSGAGAAPGLPGAPGPAGPSRAGAAGRAPGPWGGSRAAEAGPRLTAPRLCPQSQPDGEPLPGALEKEDARSAPSTPSTPSVCSPPSSSSSSTPSAGKNVCSSCGLEILDRYLLKVSGGGGGGGGGGRRRAGGPGSQPPSPPQVNNLIWHVRCLECSVCRTSLRQQHSCYIKNKEIFCKMDYFR